ncbi:alpha/beta fold hydrolase [Vagococcus sp. CY53-2]|uniref:alpha/beta fold hydrolase n=1 Tax=Vagococcus sp. CY53-2 TaxID=2925780 RepID=UPI001F5119D3|nr:alpha/beta fold hydrolase [Vagococcus sp. CY53-2]MCI0129587.1 alpha/beta hydrolase [Vagococcus sp. CY53-2]
MKKKFVIESLDGNTDLNGIIWHNSTKKPKAILQVVHGMAEYVERYDPLARYLSAHDILVIGHDHLGHGESVDMDNPLHGFFCEGDSASIIVEDTFQITQYAKSRYPDTPLFILGHSMGSFVVRNYLKKYSHLVKGAILMGSTNRRKEISFGVKMAKGLNIVSPKTKNPAMDKLLFGSFNQKFKPAHSPFSWLSKNPDNVESYEQDEQCGFIFTNNGFYTLLSLMDDATKKHWFITIQRDLPVLIISGEKDPVGNYGKGPRKLALELSDNYFKDVTLRLYNDLRHEILNEKESLDVTLDIYDWIRHRL